VAAAQDGTIADVLVIGGGVNGCGIARDAAGRGLSVVLAEMDDLASGTSSASTKLFHGGLRYLEYFEFRLVREALREREVLLAAMPHIAWPMRFVLPYHAGMRFEGGTPTSRLLETVMPWLKGRRPAWLVRFGLLLYDVLGGRRHLPGTVVLDLPGTPEGAPLQDVYRRAFEYSDCLVVLNARDASARGAEILTRTRVTDARVVDGHWHVTLRDARTGTTLTRRARVLVNAAGPWAGAVLGQVLGRTGAGVMRLVRGSHIIVPRLFDHRKCYFFQGSDGRIVFAIPYEDDFTLIGTTDRDHDGPDEAPTCTEAERDYLLNFVNGYLRRQVRAEEVVWTYAGMRALFDDGSRSATAATRDYVLELDQAAGAPLLNVFGGKITTYRRLAERAVDRLRPHLTAKGGWTAGVALPGGDFPVDGAPMLERDLRAAYPFLGAAWARRLVRTYGTEAQTWLGSAAQAVDLGRDFGATLTEAELAWLVDQEYAETVEDVVWRRTKLGLRLDAAQVASVADWLAARKGQA
jgi:glycerol-3-phosphate dehydrogenase